MNVYIHARAMQFAIGMLPASAQRVLATVAGELWDLYSIYPDIYKWKAAGSKHDCAIQYGHIPVEETGRYSRLADGSDPDFGTVSGLRTAIDYYLKAMVDCARDGQVEEFAKYAGCYSHYLVDAAGLAHVGAAELCMPRLIAPPPDSEFACLSYHGALEFISFEPEKPPEHAVRAMGADMPESVFFIRERWLACLAEVMREHIPSLQALFRKDLPEVLRRQNRLIGMAVAILADTLHTALNLAGAGAADADLVRHMSLGDVLAVEMPGCDKMYRGQLVRDYSIREVVDLGWAKVPLELIILEGGHPVQRRFKGGLGFGIPTSAAFDLNGIFESLDALLGFHATLGDKGCGRVRIMGDGRQLYDSGFMRGGEPARPISVGLKGVRRLEIVSEEGAKRDGFSGLTTCDHLVLADTLLRVRPA